MPKPRDLDWFTEAESDPSIAKDDAKPKVAALRTALLKAQYDLLQRADRSLLIVVAGLDGAGKGATVNQINEWMDARHISTMAYGPPSDEEQKYPFLWRYWRQLPANGRTGIVFGSWYTALFSRLYRNPGLTDDVQRMATAIREFETMLARNGVQLLKLWYHLSRDAQQARTKRLAANPETAWMVRPEDRRVAENFKPLCQAAQAMLTMTEDPLAPWQVIPSADDRLRSLRTGEAILTALREYSLAAASSPKMLKSGKKRRLDGVDYDAKLDEDEYDRQLAGWRSRLATLVRSEAFRDLPVILAFEGHDAAGKGSTIRRITQTLDARQYRVVPIAAPTEEELARPYLWRFWRGLPAPGDITIFDRSWYGRVLVERVEKLATPTEWHRAYDEINQLESQLTDSGILLLKFWLTITKDVQLERFREREKSPFKSFKITPEDWRNREKWAAYNTAANDMFDMTDTHLAPWHIIASNDKRHARVAVMKCVVTAIESKLSS